MLGTFAPWLRSGHVSRNSYETTGTMRRLIAPSGVLGELFRVWPLLGALCALALAAYALGLRALGVGVAVLASLAGGGAAVAALAAPSNTYASVIVTGPVITIVGAAIVLGAAAAHAVARNQRRLQDPGRNWP